MRPATVHPPKILYRVARKSDPLAFSRIAPGDAETFGGNRFDVPGAGVLYVADEPEACFLETLSRFRVSSSVHEALKGSRSSFMTPGSIPASWRDSRVLAHVELRNPLPFLDVDAAVSHTFLTERMSAELSALGIDHLDSSIVRGSDRRLTRGIARWIFAATDDLGEPLYGGIRYTSRFENLACYAVFSGTEVGLREAQPLTESVPGLLTATEKFGLTLH